MELENEYNRLLKKAIARTHRFNDNGYNYYWYRLRYLDKLRAGATQNGEIK